MIAIDRAVLHSGNLGDGLELYEAAWEECKELQCSDKYGWVNYTMRCIGEATRVEVCARVDTRVVGGIVLHSEFDPHVGNCMYVVFQYVLPEWRGRGISKQLLKMALEETRLQGLPVLAYTHRLRDWEYKTTYKKV